MFGAPTADCASVKVVFELAFLRAVVHVVFKAYSPFLKFFGVGLFQETGLESPIFAGIEPVSGNR